MVDSHKRIISETIGFNFEDDELQTVNADDLLRLATALTSPERTVIEAKLTVDPSYAEEYLAKVRGYAAQYGKTARDILVWDDRDARVPAYRGRYRDLRQRTMVDNDHIRLFWANVFKPLWLLGAMWATWCHVERLARLPAHSINLWQIALAEVKAGRPLPSPMVAVGIVLRWD